MYQVRDIGNRGVLFSTDTITGCVTNMYLIKGDRSNYLIDTGLGSGTAAFIKEYIEAHCPNDVTVINTHHHWDHVWGNGGFEGCRIIAHRTAGEKIRQTWDESEVKHGRWKEGHIKMVLPDTPVDDTLWLREDGLEIFHSPGHTADSLSVYDHADRVLYVGDNVETLMPGIYDSAKNLARSLRKYLTYDFAFCLGGHNSDIRREDIEKVLEAQG